MDSTLPLQFFPPETVAERPIQQNDIESSKSAYRSKAYEEPFNSRLKPSHQNVIEAFYCYKRVRERCKQNKDNFGKYATMRTSRVSSNVDTCAQHSITQYADIHNGPNETTLYTPLLS